MRSRLGRRSSQVEKEHPQDLDNLGVDSNTRV